LLDSTFFCVIFVRTYILGYRYNLNFKMKKHLHALFGGITQDQRRVMIALTWVLIVGLTLTAIESNANNLADEPIYTNNTLIKKNVKFENKGFFSTFTKVKHPKHKKGTKIKKRKKLDCPAYN
jgi:hypothetical protein